MLRGVEVHNLQHLDLDLPHGQLIAFCGVSGSGKTSLALDTLYAEGQRRYIESFSAYTRQFLERLEKPAAESITGIPPAIAVTRGGGNRSSRSTVGTTTETHDYLRLLTAKIGRLSCSGCGQEVRRDSPEVVARELESLADGTRYMITFPHPAGEDLSATAQALREDGFVRAVIGEQTVSLDGEVPAQGSGVQTLHVVVDRLAAGRSEAQRIRDSLETAFQHGDGRCDVLTEETADADRGTPLTLDGRRWRRIGYSKSLTCHDCDLSYPNPEPRLFSFNSPLGACGECEGFGNTIDIDMDLVVPDRSKSIRDGAIAPWTTPAYAHELEELLALADDYDVPVDVPFAELEERHLTLLREGVPEREFGGFDGFFAWLEKRKYKMHLRVFLSRWRSYHPCTACDGGRLRDEAMAFRIGDSHGEKNIAEICQMKIGDAHAWFKQLELTDWQRQVGRTMLEQVEARLGYLVDVGLGYLTLDRTLRTLSGGEAQRVALTSALGSTLVNMLYVLDEPSVGLHPRDVERLVGSIKGLRNRQNTVVVVEHEEAFLRAADQLVEIGPGAGERGGQLVYQGPPDGIVDCPDSTTGDYLAGRRGGGMPSSRRPPDHGWIRLAGARGNNLQNVTVEFPLGVLCLVTGVSGSGKSSLVQETLYGALCRRMRKDAPNPLDYDDVFGDGQLDDVLMVDQSPIGRSPRSNPVTYIKAFDEIRAVFAETVTAKTSNFTASHFSFNVDGGRCNECHGDGCIEIDMQFLADVYMACPQCHGTRYRREVLEVHYRGRNIADVLQMTAREAFTFFRGRPKVQARLKRLIDVGLDYLRLGQPANTLSAGEAQRLKLAGYMTATKRNRTLFLLDEPTTGLHFADVVQLLDCFDALLAVGHSLIVVEHNLQMMKAADYIVDLGPDAADEGGRVVIQGTPEQVARNEDSVTARFLRDAMAEALAQQSA
jgi:excinuclease ABC subunit A